MRYLVGVVVAAGVLFGGVAGAADTFQFSATQEGAPGSTAVIGTRQVPADQVGKACTVKLETHNNESVWPGNSVKVLGLVLNGVEDTKNAAPPAVVGTFVLPSTISVSLTFGEGGYTSIAGQVTVDCPPVVPPAPPAPAVVVPAAFTG